MPIRWSKLEVTLVYCHRFASLSLMKLFTPAPSLSLCNGNYLLCLVREPCIACVFPPGCMDIGIVMDLFRPLREVFFSKPPDFSVLGHLRRNHVACPHVRSLGPEESQSRQTQRAGGAGCSRYPRLIFRTCQEYACVTLPGRRGRGAAALSLRPVLTSCSAVRCHKNMVDPVMAGATLVTAVGWHWWGGDPQVVLQTGDRSVGVGVCVTC